MRLTRAAEYAVRCVLYLAGRPTFSVISRKEISRTMDIPDPFLGKIAQQLARAGIVEILQGARGGLRLLRPPETVSLLDVIETVMGELYLNDCIMSPRTCHRTPSCTVHAVWEKARSDLRRTLGEADFQTLARAAEKDSAIARRTEGD